MSEENEITSPIDFTIGLVFLVDNGSVFRLDEVFNGNLLDGCVPFGVGVYVSNWVENPLKTLLRQAHEEFIFLELLVVPQYPDLVLVYDHVVATLIWQRLQLVLWQYLVEQVQVLLGFVLCLLLFLLYLLQCLILSLLV